MKLPLAGAVALAVLGAPLAEAQQSAKVALIGVLRPTFDVLSIGLGRGPFDEFLSSFTFTSGSLAAAILGNQSISGRLQ